MNEMNVTKTGFIPLDGNEIQNTRGGCAGAIGAAIIKALLTAAGVEILSDWDNFKAGLSGEPEK